MPLQLSSTAFAQQERIPLRYACDGEDLSPPLAWTGVPPGTVELVLTCEDPDAPTAEPWTHWLLWALDPTLTDLPEALPAAPLLAEPIRAAQGLNTWGKVGYGGPAPPRGKGLHHYHFTLYALDAPLKLNPAKTDHKALVDAMRGHILDRSTLIGTYKR